MAERVPSDLALIAGEGLLPRLLAKHLAATGTAPRLLALEGVAVEDAGLPVERFPLGRIGSTLAGLREAGVGRVILAGAMRRPAIDMAAVEPASMPMLGRIAQALGKGDDALLRAVVAEFESAGFEVVGAAEAMPSLTEPPSGAAPKALAADAARGREILAALGALDIGQAVVVAGGLCHGIETLQGTAALLDFVARHGGCRGRGVLVKRAKPGQELRVDMPAIGPETVDQAIAAGLGGIAIEAGKVMLLDRETLLARAEAAGLAIWAEP